MKVMKQAMLIVFPETNTEIEILVDILYTCCVIMIHQ